MKTFEISSKAIGSRNDGTVGMRFSWSGARVASSACKGPRGRISKIRGLILSAAPDAHAPKRREQATDRQEHRSRHIGGGERGLAALIEQRSIKRECRERCEPAEDAGCQE